MAKAKRVQASLSAKLDKGAGADPVIVKLGGKFVPFDADGKNKDPIPVLIPGRYKVVITVMGARGVKGSVTFKNGNEKVFDLARTVATDNGIDHSDGVLIL